MTVLAAHAWATNAEMILDCHRLGYLNDDDLVLDPTYGRGLWWTDWKPRTIVSHNRAVDKTFDFRHLPYPDNHFDAVAFDPPYVAKGGRSTSGIAEMDDRYGMDDAPESPFLLQVLINEGLTEVHRVVRRRGVVLIKVKDYISSGRLWPATHHTTAHALSLHFEVVDRLEMITGSGPQPPGRRQVHARRNHSTLLILRKL